MTIGVICCVSQSSYKFDELLLLVCSRNTHSSFRFISFRFVLWKCQLLYFERYEEISSKYTLYSHNKTNNNDKHISDEIPIFIDIMAAFRIK